MTNGIAPTEPATAKTEPTREYVAGGDGGLGWWYTQASQRLRTLPHCIDDVTADLADDLYDRMMVDPQAGGAVNIFRASILEDGVKLTSPVEKDADGYDLGQEIAATCTTALDELDIPVDDVWWNMLDALPFGNKVGELVYRQDGKWLMLRAIKVKPRHATAFVVDQFNNILGLVGPSGLRSGADGQPTLLPLEKFAVLSFRPKDADPRGTSVLRPAYNGWWLKQQTWVEFLKYLTQFASASLVGKTPPGAKAANPGDPKPADVMLAQLLGFRNGTAVVLPAGAELDPLFSTGEGQAFHRAFELYGREIVMGVISQTRAILEAEHGSKADSQTSQDILDTLVRQAKKSVQRMIRRDVLRPFVRYNYGEAAVPLAPVVTLGNVEEQDRTPMWNAFAALWKSGALDESQRAEMCRILGLPAPTARPEAADAGTAVDETGQAA